MKKFVLFLILVLVFSINSANAENLGRIVIPSENGENSAKLRIIELGGQKERFIKIERGIDCTTRPAWNPETSEILLIGMQQLGYAVKLDGKIRRLYFPLGKNVYFNNLQVSKFGKIGINSFYNYDKRYRNCKIYLVSNDSNTQPKCIHSGNNYEWSPNDENLMLVEISNDLYLKNIDSGISEKILTNVFFPSWSADGKYIYFDDRKYIYRYGFETKKKEKIAPGKNANLSENEKYIISSDNTNYYIFDRDTKKQKFLFSIKAGKRISYEFAGFNQNQPVFIRFYPENNPGMNVPGG